MDPESSDGARMRSLSPPTQRTSNESASADDLSRTPRNGDMCPLQPGPSQLSASRPQPPVQQLAAFSLDTPSSSRPPSPGSPALQHEPVQPPTLLSTLSANDGESILVLAVDDVKQGGMASALNGSTADSNKGRVYGGSQGGAIHVWDLHTFTLRARLTGHTGAVLALQLVKERDWLISASGDGTIRVWHTPSLTPLYLIHPPHDNVGDIFSLAWVPTELLDGEHQSRSGSSKSVKGKGRLYAGCQDTSIQWIDLPPAFHLEAFSSLPLGSPLPFNLSTSASSSPPIHRAPNKFFDSLSTKDQSRSLTSKHSSSTTSLVGLARESGGTESPEEGKQRRGDEHVIELQFRQESIAVCAHYGYVYCLLLGKSNDKTVLISGSGDEHIKLWKTAHSELVAVATLESTSDAVLAITGKENTVYAGHQGGVIKIWDLDTFTCVRTLKPHAHDILTLTLLGTSLYSGAANGTLQRWNKAFNLVHTWPAHDDIVLASTSTQEGGRRLLTGGNDATLKVWDVLDDDLSVAPDQLNKGFQGEMFHTLSKLISFRTIADDENREECRQGALYLKRVLRTLGAETALLPGAPSRNPIILATFRANSPLHRSSPLNPRSAPSSTKKRKRVLCYGHYDVVSAAAASWASDPFKLVGKDGWLYGRGVSDNKGPMLAIAAAASELKAKGELDVDLVMVIEGEEETGSAGFQDAIRRNRELIGDIDVILVSNSYWIGEDTPCLTFGLRGVIHATLKITSDQPDLHSGMQGGVVSEPLVDMVRLLASLTDADGRVRIPGFLDDVRKMDKEESELLDAVVTRCKDDKVEKLRKHSHVADPRRSLMSRWRQPALSIHDVQSAGSNSKSLIPSWASAAVSIRIVPDQSLLSIIEQLKAHLAKAFGSLRTVNQLSVDINHVADWWLGNLASPYFKSLSACIAEEWGSKPLYIREGGSIPSLPFLEREFAADAVHFPMGTSSDSAHLPDERIKVVNLEKGKTIISNWLKHLGEME